MIETDPASSGETATCGNCGAAAAASAEICPNCGVLLAAYRVPAGAGEALTAVPAAHVPASSPVTMGSPVDTSATHGLPTASLAPPEDPPVFHTTAPAGLQLRSQGWLAAAPQRAHEAEAIAPDVMAAESDGAREVGADLAWSKVTFEGRPAVIMVDPEAVATSAAVPAEPTPPPAPAPTSDNRWASLPERFRPKPARDDPYPAPEPALPPPVETETLSDLFRPPMVPARDRPRMPTIPVFGEGVDQSTTSSLGYVIMLVVIGLYFGWKRAGTDTMVALAVAIVGMVVLVKLIRASLRERAAMPRGARRNPPPRRN